MKGKKKRTKKDLIADLALALEIAAIQNQFGGWGFVSPFQDLVNRLLVESGRKAVKAKKNPFRVDPHIILGNVDDLTKKGR